VGDRPEDADSHGTMRGRHLIDLIAVHAELLEAWGLPGRARIRIRLTATLNLTTEVGQLAQPQVSVFGRASHAPQGRT
jgi:hypothetical protein